MSAPATLIAEADFGPRASPSRMPGAGWLVTRESGALALIDETLATIARFRRSSKWRASHWVTPDLERAVLSERDRVVLIDRDGRTVWQVQHYPWGDRGSESGSCCVSPDGRVVWATVPSADGADEWWVLDAADGKILGVAALHGYAAGSEPIPHPDGKHIGLSAGEGQDGCEVYWGHWDGSVHVSRLDARDRVLCAVRPDGTAYLATPHGGGELTVHSFPTGDVRARLSDSDVFGDDDRFEFQAGYVTNDIVLVGSTEEERHLLLRADTLEVVAEIEYPEGATRGGISPTGSGAWLTCDYLSGRLQLWRGRWS